MDADSRKDADAEQPVEDTHFFSSSMPADPNDPAEANQPESSDIPESPNHVADPKHPAVADYPAVTDYPAVVNCTNPSAPVQQDSFSKTISRMDIPMRRDGRRTGGNARDGR